MNNDKIYPVLAGPQKPIDQLTMEDDLVKAFVQAIGEAEEAARQEIKIANRNFRYLQGDQFLSKSSTGDWITDTNNPYWRLRLIRDIIQPVVSTNLAVLHKLRPKMLVEADYPDKPVVAYHEGQHIPLPFMGYQAAGQLQNAIEAEWERRSEEVLQAEVLIDCMVTGNAFRTYMPVYDESGIVRIRPYLLHRSQFLGDPQGSNLATFDDFKYVIIEQTWDVADIERIYNVKERDFAKGDETDNKFYAPDDVGLYRKQYQWREGAQMGQRYKQTSQARRQYSVHTIFYNQGTPDVIAYGKTPPKALKYPLGRQMVLINKRKLVADRHNPYWHGRFPITAYQTMPMPHCGGGHSDVSQLIGIQDSVNILQNMIVTNAMVLGVPQWMAEDGAVDESDVTNEPGALIFVRPGTMARNAFERIETSTMSGDIYSIIRDLQSFAMEDLGDVSEALQGKNLGSNASGVYANTLLGASLTKQGFRGQMLDVAHRRSAWIELMMMQQFMRVEEGYINKNHDLGELLEMNLAMQELFFDVKVESQGDLPHNPSARINLAANLFQMGIFDVREFMRFTGLKVRPELENILNEASEFFMPAVPQELQAQIRSELAVAQMQLEQQRQGISPGGQQGGGSPQQGTSNVAGSTGEETSGVGASAGSGAAGNPNQRVL